MKTYSKFIVSLLVISTLNSCGSDNTEKLTEKPLDQSIDYTKVQVIDSLAKNIPSSNDSIFLGFKMGMTKSDYKAHINNLIKSGKNITYATSHTLSTSFGNLQLGDGYTFTTGISSKKNGQLVTGEGKYLLEPQYNKNGELNQLSILPTEKWDIDFSLDSPNWLNTNILENTSKLNDKSLVKALVDLRIIDGNHLIRRKGNVIIYEGSLAVRYIDFKTLLNQMKNEIKTKEMKHKESEDVKF